MELNPNVSIVIPVYNGANYMQEAIDSALLQTYKNIEVIVINDGSDDDGETERIAKAYGDRIHYYHKKNGGVASALNLGIELMKGDYFSWLSHDDVYYPNKVEKQIEYLKKEKDNNILLYGDYNIIDQKSRFVRSERIPDINPDSFVYALITSWPIHGCTALIPKKCFCDIGLFNERLKTTQDYEMWFRMAEKFKFVHIDEVLVKSRIHPQQGTLTMREAAQRECNQLYADILKDLSIESMLNMTETSTSLGYARISLALKKKGCVGAAYIALKKSLLCWAESDLISAIKSIFMIGYCMTYRPLLSVKYSLGKIKRAHENPYYSRI